MKYPKGTEFQAQSGTYVVVGKTSIGGAYVLAPQDKKNIEVLMYTGSEIEEGLESGWLTLKR